MFQIQIMSEKLKIIKQELFILLKKICINSCFSLRLRAWTACLNWLGSATSAATTPSLRRTYTSAHW